MTVHIDKVKPFLGEVPKSWLADKPSSDVKDLPKRADNGTMGETFRNEPSNEPSFEQVYVETFDDELICEPELEEESVPRAEIPYEVDSTQPTARPRREVRAPKYLDKYVRLMSASKQESD